MKSFSFKDHEIGDVYDTDAKSGTLSSENGGGDDNFEHELGADPYEDYIGRETVVCAAEFPDRGAGLAVGIGFFDGKKDGLGLFGSDH